MHRDGQQGINNVCLWPWLIPSRAPASHIAAQSVWSNNTLQARPKDFRKTFFMFPFRAPSACIYGPKDAADKGLQVCLHFQGRNHMCSPAGSLPHFVQAVQKLKAIKGILKLCRGGHLEETGSLKNVWRKAAVPRSA